MAHHAGDCFVADAPRNDKKGGHCESEVGNLSGGILMGIASSLTLLAMTGETTRISAPSLFKEKGIKGVRLINNL